jgi:hypothetical protein
MGARRRDAPVCTREVVNRALDLGTPALILVHNHVNQKNGLVPRGLGAQFLDRVSEW